MATLDSMSGDSTRLSDGPDWTFELLDVYGGDRPGGQTLSSGYLPHQIEVITSEQMMDAYSSVGMPINYPHWSFGKNSLRQSGCISTGSRDWRMKSSLTLTHVLPI